MPDHSDTRAAIRELQNIELRLRGLNASLNGHLTTPPSRTRHTHASGVEEHEHDGLRDLTHMAVWTVSSAKPGNGVEQLLDSNPNTYWQSDGLLPHSITAQFPCKVKICEIQLYFNYKKDESYTPSFISIRAGSNFHDLHVVRECRRFRAPRGWMTIPMGEHPDFDDEWSDNDSDVEREDMTPAELTVHNGKRDDRQKRRAARFEDRVEKLKELRIKAETGVNGQLEMMKNRNITRAHMIQITIVSNHLNGRDSHVRMVRVLGPKTQLSRGTSQFTSKEFQMYETIR